MGGKGKAILAIFGFVVVVGACQNAINGDEPNPVSAVVPSTVSAAPPSATTTAEAAEPVGEVITVKRVIDGDTFETGDGRTVRLLGIDSCERGTYGYKEAKDMAKSQLTNPYNQPITMRAEPTGDDHDRDGRLLRYVSLNGSDFGEFMVQYDHTGVYQGDNDASDAYVRLLYSKDTALAMNPPAGRNCEDPYPASSGGGGIDLPDNDDDHHHRGGDGSIIPACKHKWWC